MPAPLTPLGARTPHAHPALYGVIAVLSAIIIAGVVWVFLPRSDGVPLATPTPSAESVEYLNEDYGVLVSLPESWRGFTVRTENRLALGIASGSQDETFTEIHIVHPRSTDQSPRQDIPIMVFTHEQWDRVLREELSVGAAPIPPSELASNGRFVFALPARYNYAFVEGWEEVQAILDDESVFGFDPEP